jgi:hypothetical protein
LDGCLSSLATADQQLLQDRAGRSGSAPQSLAVLSRRLEVSRAAVRGRIRRATGRLRALAQRTGCASGVAASAGGSVDGTAATLAAAGASGGSAAGDPGHRSPSSMTAADRPAAGDGRRSDRRTERQSTPHPLGGLLDDPPSEVWILGPLLLLLAVTAAAVGREVRRALSVGGRLPPPNLAQRWRTARRALSEGRPRRH